MAAGEPTLITRSAFGLRGNRYPSSAGCCHCISNSPPSQERRSWDGMSCSGRCRKKRRSSNLDRRLLPPEFCGLDLTTPCIARDDLDLRTTLTEKRGGLQSDDFDTSIYTFAMQHRQTIRIGLSAITRSRADYEARSRHREGLCQNIDSCHRHRSPVPSRSRIYS